jgi:hypothetical protein
MCSQGCRRAVSRSALGGPRQVELHRLADLARVKPAPVDDWSGLLWNSLRIVDRRDSIQRHKDSRPSPNRPPECDRPSGRRRDRVPMVRSRSRGAWRAEYLCETNSNVPHRLMCMLTERIQIVAWVAGRDEPFSSRSHSALPCCRRSHNRLARHSDISLTAHVGPKNETHRTVPRQCRGGSERADLAFSPSTMT